MKHIDADKLIAVIEGIIAAVQTMNHPDALGTMEQCMAAAEIEALNLVLDAIKGLQQEQPEVDLEKEIHRYFNPHGMKLQFDRSKGNTILKPEQLFNFARHFAEWGAIYLNARKEGQK